MQAATMAILNLADVTLPGGRQTLFNDLAELIADQKYYSAESVAKKLDVSLSCVKNWRAKGILVPSLTITGGTVRYTLADINKALSNLGRKEAEQA